MLKTIFRRIVIGDKTQTHNFYTNLQFCLTKCISQNNGSKYDLGHSYRDLYSTGQFFLFVLQNFTLYII
jgi:hypothetical protein